MFWEKIPKNVLGKNAKTFQKMFWKKSQKIPQKNSKKCFGKKFQKMFWEKIPKNSPKNAKKCFGKKCQKNQKKNRIFFLKKNKVFFL